MGACNAYLFQFLLPDFKQRGSGWMKWPPQLESAPPKLVPVPTRKIKIVSVARLALGYYCFLNVVSVSVRLMYQRATACIREPCECGRLEATNLDG